MHAAKDDFPVCFEIPGVLTSRQARWGDLNVAVEHRAIGDPTDFLAAQLPGGRCQCPHWGYLISGRLRVKYSDHDELISEGDVYYLPAGHIPIVEQPIEIVEFSPLAAYEQYTAALTT